jgi:hypothetical protein
MVTWIEVVDSAVKIGLGALIAGVFAVYRDTTVSKSERKKFYLNEEHLTLKETIKLVSEFQDTFRKCVVSTDSNIQTKFEAMWSEISKLTTAVTNLLYLELESSHKALISYNSAVESYIGDVQSNIQKTGGDKYQNRLEPHYQNLVNQYEGLIKKIATDFKGKENGL